MKIYWGFGKHQEIFMIALATGRSYLLKDIISDFPICCWYRENEMNYICITDKELYKRDMENRNVEKSGFGLSSKYYHFK